MPQLKLSATGPYLIACGCDERISFLIFPEQNFAIRTSFRQTGRGHMQLFPLLKFAAQAKESTRNWALHASKQPEKHGIAFILEWYHWPILTSYQNEAFGPKVLRMIESAPCIACPGVS
jgi:hypothetical protein